MVFHNFDIFHNFYFMTRRGNFFVFFQDQFSTFHEKKNPAYINILRHASLHIYGKN